MAFFAQILAALAVANVLPTAHTSQDKGLVSTWSRHMNLGPTLEDPSSSWLLEKDDFSETVEMPCSIKNVEVKAAPNLPRITANLPSISEALLLTVAALSLGVSLSLRGLCSQPTLSDHLPSPKANETTDTFGCTELHVAAAEGSALLARKLLEGGSDPNAREAWEETRVAGLLLYTIPNLFAVHL